MIVADAAVLANAVGNDGDDGATAQLEIRQAHGVAAPDLVNVEAAAVLRKRWISGDLTDDRLGIAVEVNGQAALVVVEVARRGSVNNGEVRALLAVDSVEARSILQDLVTNGVLVKEGQRGGTQYLIADHLGVPARIRHTDDELDAIALELAAQGPVSNAELRQRTGLDRTEALAVFRRLVERGALVQVGERRGSRYQLPRID